MRYNNLSAYLKTKYGKKIGKICIDGGFTCPNRDGTLGIGGCIYCSMRGSGEHIDATLDIRGQVEKGLKNPKYDGFIAYFQNFTNTYADIETLKFRYDEALISDKIVALAIGTRPDCISEKIADLLNEYKRRVDVLVELGLQTASDTTAKIINRGYMLDRYKEAARILCDRDIPFVTHMIIGLPNENEEDVLNTVEAINKANSQGVKIHSLYVAKNTALEAMYKEGKYTPISKDEYIRLAALAIAKLRPDIVVHRITGDCSKEELIAPEWILDKTGVIDGIRKKLEDDGVFQGDLYNK